MPPSLALLGAPIDTGASRPGCSLGPAALRSAGLVSAACGQGWQVADLGDLSIPPQSPERHPNAVVHHLAETRAWTVVLEAMAQRAAAEHDLTVFAGGDHSMAAGTVAGMAAHAAKQGRPIFVLWLDAHSDFHSLETTESGNLHGTPVARFTGQPGFDAFSPPKAPVPPDHVLMLGLRSVDRAERDRLTDAGVQRADRCDGGAQLPAFLARVRALNGLLHVSLDVDYLQPALVPAAGTPVPGGATLAEARRIMALLAESGLVTSLDLAELNPQLDPAGRTAALLVDLTTTLLAWRTCRVAA